MTMYYRDRLQSATIPSGSVAANIPSSMGLGNLWMTALTTVTRGKNANGDSLQLALTGGSGTAPSMYPCSDTGGADPLFESPTPGLFAVVRLKFEAFAMGVKLHLSTSAGAPNGPYCYVYQGYGTSQNDNLAALLLYDGAGNFQGAKSFFPHGEMIAAEGLSSCLDVAMVVRKPVSGVANTWWVEVWSRVSYVGNMTADWVPMGMLTADWSGGTIVPVLTVLPVTTISGTQIQSVDVVEFAWGAGDALNDPGSVSRNKPIGFPVSALSTVSPENTSNPEAGGIVINASGIPYVLFSEGDDEITPDQALNLYEPIDTLNFSSWQLLSSPFPQKTLPGITLSGPPGSTVAVTTATTGIGNTFMTRKLVLHDAVNGTTTITLPAQILSYNAAYDLSNIAAAVSAVSGWSASLMSGASATALATLVEQAATAPGSIDIWDVPWNPLLIQNGSLVVAFSTRGNQNTAQNLAINKSTNYGVTWQGETSASGPLNSNVAGGGCWYSGFFSATQNKYFLFGYNNAAGWLATCPGGEDPSVEVNWTVSSVAYPTIGLVEPFACEILDPNATAGSVLFLVSHGKDPSYLGFGWSQDGGVTWNYGQFNGQYNAGVQTCSYITNKSGPASCFCDSSGYVYVFADDTAQGNTGRAGGTFYRSTAPVTAAALTAGTVLFERHTRQMSLAPLPSVRTDYSFPVVYGTALFMAYGRDLKRIFVDPFFFAESAYGLGYTTAQTNDAATVNEMTSDGASILDGVVFYIGSEKITGSYPGGNAATQLAADQATVAALTTVIVAGNSVLGQPGLFAVSANNPVPGSELFINCGDDYPLVRAIQYGVPPQLGSIAGATVTLDITQLVGGIAAPAPVVSIEGVILNGSYTINDVTYAQIVQFQPTAAQTALLTEWSPRAYQYRVRALWTDPEEQTITIVQPSPCTAVW